MEDSWTKSNDNFDADMHNVYLKKMAKGKPSSKFYSSKGMPRPAREMIRGHEEKGKAYKVTAQIRHNMNTGHYPANPHVSEFTRMHEGVVGMYSTKDNEERKQMAA